MKCTQPGCPGTIVDGYCDVCGLPPGSPPQLQPQPSLPQAGAGRSTPVVSSGPVGVVSGACPQPGCTGKIVDGYCDVCGNPPDAAPITAEAAAATAAAAEQSGLRSLPSIAMGSALLAEPGKGRVWTPAAGRSTGTHIGAGLTHVPPAPTFPPEQALMQDPQVPESRRICPQCGAPVGRAHGDQPGATTGVCDNCGTPFDFEPAIRPGELVADQYQVAGVIAYGGMGWIYLARDRNVSDRWCVLKGLLNSGDEDARAAAKSEKEFLAQVSHPLLVEIYNFVSHGEARYIVMEYVAGRSLKDLLKQRKQANGGKHDPLPVDWALAYVIEALPALSYLHGIGLLYCDFKPDNLMQDGDALRIIDLGAVRRLDDQTSAIFGTVGYQAPEVATLGCSVASDLYTVGRTLMLLVDEVPGYQGQYATTLPPLSELPVLARHESLWRIVQRCCAQNRDDRFHSAEELRQQLLGVLREEVGTSSGAAATTPHVSAFFTPPAVTGEAIDWRGLPGIKPDAADPMWDWLAALDVTGAKPRLAALEKAPQRTAAVLLEQIRLALQQADQRTATRVCRELLSANPWEWRAVWMQGVVAMQTEQWRAAQAAFNTVYSQLPGEVAPRFALAVTCERAAQLQVADAMYRSCLYTDASYVTSAAFGLARVRQLLGDLQGSLDALSLVPASSRGFSDARRSMASLVLAQDASLAGLAQALTAVRNGGLDAGTTAGYEVSILQHALDIVLSSGPQPKVRIGGGPATERTIRPQLEDAYRRRAHWEQDPRTRTEMIGKANSTRRWSLL